MGLIVKSPSLTRAASVAIWGIRRRSNEHLVPSICIVHPIGIMFFFSCFIIVIIIGPQGLIIVFFIIIICLDHRPGNLIIMQFD